MIKIVEFYQKTDTNGLEQQSKIFKNLEFYIINTDDTVASKSILEKLIFQNNGKSV